MMERYSVSVCNPGATVLYVDAQGRGQNSGQECLGFTYVNVGEFANRVEITLEDGSVIQIPNIYVITKEVTQ